MLENAWNRNETQSIHNISHSIKGLAVTLGFERLSHLAFILETTAQKSAYANKELEKTSVPSPEDLKKALDDAEEACINEKLFGN